MIRAASLHCFAVVIALLSLLGGMGLKAEAGHRSAGRQAQTRQAEQTIASRLDSPSHLFWEIRTERTTIHLLGSIHVGGPAMYPLPARIENALAASRVVVVEARLPGARDATFQQLVAERGFFRDGRSLASLLGPELYAATETRLKLQGLTGEAIQRMKPWAASLVLGQRQNGMARYSPYWGVEEYLLRKLRGDQSVEELEGAERQIAALDAIPESSQVAMVREALNPPPNLMAQLLQAWERGDERRFTGLFLDSFSTERGLAGTYDVLLKQRNVGMTDRLLEWERRGGSYFVIVGAGHLVGPESIIQLLREHGLQPVRK